jgi:hypothetical protein
MAVSIPQLVYWLALTVDAPTADAFKNSGSISAPDAAAVDAAVASPIVDPLLQALRAAASQAQPGQAAVAPWRPLCRLADLQALAQTPQPA